MNFSNKKTVPLLIIILVIFSGLLYHATITTFPMFIHAWSQADRYSLALGFLRNGFDLFHPQTFDLETVNGVTRVDFPISEYIIAIVMKILGTTSFAVFRMYTLCLSITGLVYLYLLVKKITGSELKSGLTVFFVFLSPVYVWYQDGFIPSIPALAFTFIAYYHFFSYKENANRKQLIYSILFFTLAALVRMPFVIFLVAALLQQGWMVLKTKTFKLSEFVIFAAGFIVFAAYFAYNLHLYRIYGSIFLDHLMQPKSAAELKEILAEMYHHWGLHYFTKMHYLLLLAAIILALAVFVKQKSIIEKNKKYWFNLFIIFCGTLIYFLLMARQFYSHDYYFLDSLFIPIIFLFVFCINTISFQTSRREVVLASIFVLSVILFFNDTKAVQAERCATGSWDRPEITRQNFVGTAAYLDSIGISKDAKILVIDAYTYNVPFILMQRKGYPILGTTRKNISTSLFWCKWDYVAIQDLYLVSDVIKNYPPITAMLERIGGNGKVSFYKRSEKIQPKSLKQFLGITPESVFYKSGYSSKTSATHVPAKFDAATEFGMTASAKATDLKQQEGLKVFVTADFLAKTDCSKIELVAAVSNKDTTVFYQSFGFKDYFKPAPNWQKMEFQFVLPPFSTRDDELKVYLWNPGKEELLYDNWEVTVYK